MSTETPRSNSPTRRLAGLAAAAVAGLAMLAAPAPAAADVEWTGDFRYGPTNMEPGERAGFVFRFANAGDTAASDWPTFTIELPPGVTFAETDVDNAWFCSGTSTVTCSNFFGQFLPPPPHAYAAFGQGLPIVVDVDPAAPAGTHQISIEMDDGGTSPVVTKVFDMIIGGGPTEFGPTPGSFEAGAFDENGDPYTQAGGHPHEATTSFGLNTKFSDPASSSDDSRYVEMVDSEGITKDVIVDLPAGFVGDPSAGPKCPSKTLTTQPRQQCPAETQVGVATYQSVGDPSQRQMSAVYNMVPAKGEPARFAFPIPTFGAFIRLVPVLRSDGDWGLSAAAYNIDDANPVFSTSVTLWGVPADPVHDEQRCQEPNFNTGTCVGVNEIGQPPQPQFEGMNDARTSSAPLKPFLSNPTRCTGEPEVTKLHTSDWDDPAPFKPNGDPDLSDPRWKSEEAEAPAVTGCESLVFEPQVSIQPTSDRADSPTGLEVKITTPQNDNPDGLAPSHLRDVVVDLPEGMSVNPSSADGLAACTPGQVGLVSKSPVRFNKESAQCPDGSKIGSIEIDTPLLDEPLEGDVFVAEQDNNPFDSLLAMYLVIESEERGLIMKLAGHVEPDDQTGRLETTFEDNPQLPFNTLSLRLKGGARAPLATPPVCGTHTTEAELVPWAAPHIDSAERTDTFNITQGPNGGPCAATLGARPFGPALSAGLRSPVAGSTSPFVLRLTRPDGHQEVSSMEVTPPEGLAAYLKGIPLCSDAAANAGNCAPASKVGRTIVGAGAGSSPFFVDGGEAFLTGPYKGAPLGLLIKVPAVAGPFNLGMVNVRAAVHVDPRTAQLRVASDPIPQILEGIPLRVRDIRVLMDREGFTVAPTDCSEKAVAATVHGSHGATAQLSDRFQVGECASLDFGPDFRFEAKGRRATRPNGHPRLETTVLASDEQANISRARVILPRGVFLDQDSLETICTRAQFAQRECPDNTRIGFAVAHSPLLDDPLRGPVHLIASDNPLPDIVADLRGIVDITLFGRISSNRRTNRITTTFDVVPDAAVERFELTVRGGPQGLLVNSRNTCRKPAFRRTHVRVLGHNGKTAHQTRMVQSRPCARQRANQLTRRAKKLRQRARKAARNGNRQRAKRLRQRSRRLQRRASNIRQNLRPQG